MNGGRSDGSPSISAYQVLVLATIFLVVLIDGYDTQAISLAAPSLREEFGGNHQALGSMFSAGLFGGLIGGLVFGPLGDRFGRKPIILASLFIISVGSALTLFENDVAGISLLRLFTGVGLGGAIPGVISIAAEYAPRGRRSLVVALVFSGFPLGAVTGAIVSALVLLEFGWRAIFTIGAIAPLVLFVVSIFVLPESLAWLQRDGRHAARAARIVARLGQRASDDLAPADGGRGGPAPFLDLFREGRGVGTLLLWLICFLSLLGVYGLVSWIPTLVRDAGLPLQVAVLSAGALNIGSVFGNLILARIADRHAPYVSMALSYLIGGACIGLVGQATGSSATMLLACFAAGLFAIGAQLSLTALIASFYPTSVRATGVGWSFAISRVGGVVGPSLAAMLLAGGVGFQGFMIAAGSAAAAAGLTVLALGATRPRSEHDARPTLAEV